MADEIARLESAIVQFKAAIESLSGLPDAQAPLQRQLSDKQVTLAMMRAQSATQVGRDLNIAASQTIPSTLISLSIFGLPLPRKLCPLSTEVA